MNTCVPATLISYSLNQYINCHSFKNHNALSFDITHDVGCGLRKASVEIAKRFNHIKTSEGNESFLDAARRYLIQSTRKIKYSQCAEEELGLRCSPQSAVSNIVIQCLPLMELSVTLSAFARVI